MRFAGAALFLVACTQTTNIAAGPSCPGQETAPPSFPPQSTAPAMCTVGPFEHVPSRIPDAPPLAEDAALAQASPSELTQAALRMDAAANLGECIRLEKKALAVAEDGRARLHLASCERRDGKLVDALADAQKALEVGVEAKDGALMKHAHIRVEEALALISHVRFVAPPGVEITELSFDHRPVAPQLLTKTFSIDAGHHTLELNGLESGRIFQHTCDLDIAESTLVPILLSLH